MNRLALTSTILGAAMVLTRLPGVIAPDKFRAHALKFPRSVWWGRVLIGIAAVWSGIVVYNAAAATLNETVRDTGQAGYWSYVPALVVIGFPIAYWLVVQFGNPYLAMRGAAALALLVAKVAVDAADTGETPARLVVTVTGYMMVVGALWMTIAPHHIRDAINFMMANNTRCRAVCSVAVGLGAVLMALGMFVY